MSSVVRGVPTEQLPQALLGDAGYLAVRLGQISQRGFEKAMSELGLRPPHYDYMVAVSECGPISQKSLAKIINMDTAKIVALTDELEALEIVIRTADPSDRRRNLVTFTKNGQAVLIKAKRKASKAENDLLDALNTKEQDQLRALLRKTQNL